MSETRISDAISKELGIKGWQTEAVIRLIDEGNTIPFIARYRKEATGALNDEQLRQFDERLRYLRNLEERKQTILKTVEEQGKLTDVLRMQIEQAETAVILEDLYRPYKPKRRTRAMMAQEKGLQGLAEYLLSQEADHPAEEEALKYLSHEKQLESPEEALQGAMDIIAERVSDDADCRSWIRKKTFQEGVLESEAKDPEQSSVYENYYAYQEALKKLPGHRVLALNRGEKEKILRIRIQTPQEEILNYLEKRLRCSRNRYTESWLKEAVQDAYKRLIAPSIETELRAELTEKAEEGAMKLFGSNLQQLLMQAPLEGKIVLGWDPAFRTGCKLAVVDATGKVLDTVVIYPTAPQNKVKEAEEVLKKLIQKYQVDVISLGNGTASRESEQLIAEFIKICGRPLQYVIVNEAGASVYSASKLGAEEFPQFDVGQRSAVSIARRLQDPLAELVKIDPKSIGVGQYQHDMNQNRLGETLGAVVEDCVNRVGVDVNTASAALLEYISGVTRTIARNIVAYREEHGSFRDRKELLKVPKLGPKAFEQSAGFLRIRDGKEVLDMTGVHPESYAAARQLLTKLGFTEEDVRNGNTRKLSDALQGNRGKQISKELEEELGIGNYTLQDIIAELEKPGRDPRADVPGPVLRSDVMDLKDLKPGMILKGTVRNVIDFGAFVDIGVHQDGLVHISELSERYIRHPLDAVKVGDIVDVRILSVDVARRKIALSMKNCH